MPNWCYNQGSISGTKDSIKKFIKDIEVLMEEKSKEILTV